MARILANIHWPFALAGHTLRSFRDYPPPDSADPTQALWRAERERRPLSAILPLIPAAERPDILLCSSPEYLPIPRDIHAFPGAKVLLITDWNICLRFLPDLCRLFDYCFTDWPGYRLLRKAGIANVHHQPLFGHDPDRFRVLDPAPPRDLDVSFCGNLNSDLHGDRNRLAARVARWADRAKRPVHLRQAFDQDYVELLNRSRLVFNFSIRREANMRLFEAMACGAVPLVEESNQETSILFQEGRHFFKYPEGGLEARLDALLAEPDRIRAVAEAARDEVARHTKARQLEALLDTVQRESSGRTPGAAPPPALSSRMALAKVRVLGMGFTLKEALAEIQETAPLCPGLDREALPALLISILEREQGPVVPAARQALAHLLSGDLPEFLRRYLALQAARLAGEWSAVPGLAEACRRALEAAAPGEVLPGGALYATLLPPVDLGKGLNSDLNRAFLSDLSDTAGPGSDRTAGRGAGPDAEDGAGRAQAGGAGRDLLLRHCAFAGAEALLRQGLPSAAFSAAQGLASSPLAASIPLFPLLLSAAVEAGDAQAVREVGRAWFEVSPLDVSTWDALAEAYGRIGDRAARMEILEEALLLSHYFQSAGKSDVIADMIRRERTAGA